MAEKQVKDYEKFVVRFPDGMRDAVAERARRNGRSMNSEIVQMIQDALDSEAKGSPILNGVGIKEIHRILDRVIEETLGNKKNT
jgi:plasmid stability protein